MIKRTPQEWADWTGCRITVHSNEVTALNLDDGSCWILPEELVDLSEEEPDNVYSPGKPNLWEQMAGGNND